MSESDSDSESALARPVMESALASDFQSASGSELVQSASGSELVQSESELALELDSQWDSDSATVPEFDSASDFQPERGSVQLLVLLLQYPLLRVCVDFVCLAQRLAPA